MSDYNCKFCGSDDIRNTMGVHICANCGINQSSFKSNKKEKSMKEELRSCWHSLLEVFNDHPDCYLEQEEDGIKLRHGNEVINMGKMVVSPLKRYKIKKTIQEAEN